MLDGAGPFHARPTNDHNQGGSMNGFLILFATATAFIVWLLVAGD